MFQWTLIASGAGFLASVALVAGIRHLSRHDVLVDHPNERSLHVTPTPRGGGVGVMVAVSLAMGSVGVLIPDLRATVVWVIAPGLAVSIIGFVDDVHGVDAATRLMAHVAIATALVIGVGGWPRVVWPGLGSVNLGWLGVPFSIVFLIGLTNAYNFMDGIDGIAGSQAVIAGIGWTGLGALFDDPLLTVTGAVLATSSAGFLVFNWPPAKVFMGDVGSSFTGFLLAALCVVVARRSPVAATAGVVFVWPFVFDTTFTFVRRAVRREQLMRAHRSHLYQRLVLSGRTHGTVSLLYGGLALSGLAVSIPVVCGSAMGSIAGALVIGVLAVGLWQCVLWHERMARTRRAACAAMNSGEPMQPTVL